MSTYVYLVCLDHNPPLLSFDEVGQHLYDLPRIREDIGNRVELARSLEGGLLSWPWNGDADAYFRTRAAQFLATHLECHIGIRDEYGIEHPIVEPVTGRADAPVIIGTVTNEGAMS